MTPRWTADGRMVDPLMDETPDLRAPHDGDAPVMQYREARTPHGSKGFERRGRERMVARMAKDGWRVHSIRSGGLFGNDVILFEKGT